MEVTKHPAWVLLLLFSSKTTEFFQGVCVTWTMKSSLSIYNGLNAIMESGDLQPARPLKKLELRTCSMFEASELILWSQWQFHLKNKS